MPHPHLGEIAYRAYCAMLEHLPDWGQLSWRERLAWGASVQAGLEAALDVTRAVAPVLPLREGVCQRAYVLYVLEHRPLAEVCAQLGISRRTLYRYVAQQKRAVQAA